MAIHLPSGCSKKKNDIEVRLGPSGDHLEIDFVWPEVLTNVNTLYKFRLEAEKADDKIESYHPIIVGFRNFFRAFRSKESEKITRATKLRLPKEVETTITKRRLKWKLESLRMFRVLYLNLKCAEDTYVANSDTESVEA